MKNINWILIRAKLKEAILVLPHFFKNPVQGMRMLPDWDWPTMLLLQAAFAAACAVVANILARSFWGVITGVVLAPLASIVMVAVGTGFFYYTFLFFFKREVPYRQIYLNLIFAAIPIQIAGVISPIIPPVILVGVAATMFLMFVGFVENFHLERVKLRKLLVGMGILYAVFWASQMVTYNTKHDRARMKATPASLDILEKELKFEE